MYWIQLINSWGYVHDYIKGETREAVVDQLRREYPAAGWSITQDFANSDKFWTLVELKGFSKYSVYIYEGDKLGKPLKES